MRRFIRPLTTTALCLAVLGCEVPDADAPAAAYRSFAAAMNHGDPKTAWALLSHDTQQLLSQQAEEVAKARGLPPPVDGRQLALSDALIMHHEIKSTSVATRSPDRATVTVTDDAGGQQNITLVREGAFWHVDLTAELAHVTHG